MFGIALMLSFSIVVLILISTCYILHNYMKLANKELDRRHYERNNLRATVEENKFNKFKRNKKEIIIDVDCEIIEERGNFQRYLPIKK